MTSQYPILHTFPGRAALVLSTVHAQVQRMLSSSALNFAVNQVRSGDYLETLARYHNSPMSSGVELDREQELDVMLGYNRSHRPLAISDPTSQRGRIQVVGDNLVFLRNGIPIDTERDGYLFSYALDQFYTDRTFAQVIKEFLDAGYRLCESEEDPFGLLQGPSPSNMPGKIIPVTLDKVLEAVASHPKSR